MLAATALLGHFPAACAAGEEMSANPMQAINQAIRVMSLSNFTFKFYVLYRLLLAFPSMIEPRFGSFPLTIVAIRFTVAAAHRQVHRGAHLRYLLTFA